MDFQKEIEQYQPCCAQERSDQALISSLIQTFPQTILTRECAVAHITSSGFIVNERRDKTLMAYHNIYQSWAWTGGHADAESDLLAVALREAKEETGIAHVKPLSVDISALDVLTVPAHYKRGEFVSAHLHLSVSYLLIAPEEQALTVKEDENSGVRWIALNELERCCNEPEMLPVYNKLIEKMRKIE